MGTPRPDAIDTLAEMAAQHVVGRTAEDDDGALYFWIEDGEAAVDIRHDIGDPLAAARALERLAAELMAHGGLLRRQAQQRHHGPVNGPVPWSRGMG